MHEGRAHGTTLDPVLRWMEQHLAEPLNLEEIARRARWSTRTLSRRFREQTGTTPGQWVLSARMRRAQQLLETTDFSVEQVATEVGFDSVSAFRDRFHRLLSTSPGAYRRAFKTARVSTRPKARSNRARVRLREEGAHMLVQIVLFDGFDPLDVVAPYEAFWAGGRVFAGSRPTYRACGRRIV